MHKSIFISALFQLDHTERSSKFNYKQQYILQAGILIGKPFRENTFTRVFRLSLLAIKLK